jgi:hypothetical protein
MISWETFLESLKTGSGFWHPLVWILAFIIAFLVVFIIRGMGNKKYKKGTEQTKVFLSGNAEPEKELMHIKGKNLFWGFTESLEWVYKILEKMHTGNVSDYVLWFVITLGIFFLILGVF